MTLFPRFSALLLCLLPFAAAQAADGAHWPVAWKAGDHWTYETESLNHEIEGGKSQITRSTDLTDVRVVEADRNGSVQTWTTRNSRIEAVEGDRRNTDLIAPMLEEFDGYAVVFELDGEGRYRRVRNLEETAVKVRQVMLPLTGVNVDQMAADLDPGMSATDRASAVSVVRQQLDAMMTQFFSLETVEAMTNGGMKTFTAFVGARMDVGERHRDDSPIESPLHGRPLPARREYTVTLDKQDPALARVQWTQTLDQNGDADALWHLVAELTTGGREAGKHAPGRPSGLELREEGFMLFHRDTGVVEMAETTLFSRYGDLHQETRRSRMRLQGSRHAWAPEDARRH